MAYVVDLDPTHRVLRITVTTPVMDDESFEEMYHSVARMAATGGPYAAIMDLSQVEDFGVSPNTIMAFAASAPAVPGERPRVIVASQPVLYGLVPMFELQEGSMGVQVQVADSIHEAYEVLEVSPEDFTQRLLPERMAA
jgi:hypothetical protein